MPANPVTAIRVNKCTCNNIVFLRYSNIKIKIKISLQPGAC